MRRQLWPGGGWLHNDAEDAEFWRLGRRWLLLRHVRQVPFVQKEKYTNCFCFFFVFSFAKCFDGGTLKAAMSDISKLDCDIESVYFSISLAGNGVVELVMAAFFFFFLFFCHTLANISAMAVEKSTRRY